MKVSLFIIVIFFCAYTTWVQTVARNVISKTGAREVQLMQRLGCSEKARILAETALAAAKKELENRNSAAAAPETTTTDVIVDGTSPHHSAALSNPVHGM